MASMGKEKPHEVPGYYFNVIADKALDKSRVEPEITQTLRGRVMGKWSLQLALGIFAILAFTIGGLLIQSTHEGSNPDRVMAQMENLDEADFEILLADMDNEDAGLYLTEASVNELEASITFVDNSFDTDDLYMYDLDETIIMEGL